MAEQSKLTPLTTLAGAFAADHDLEVTGLRGSNKRANMVFLGQQTHDDQTHSEVWGVMVPRKSGAKFQTLMLVDEHGDQWKEIAWANITDFVPWIERIVEPTKTSKEKRNEACKNWSLMFPDPTSLKRTGSPTAQTPPKPTKRSKNAETTLTFREADDEPRDRNKEPKSKISIAPLTARMLSFVPGYTEYFSEEDFGPYRREAIKPKDLEQFMDAEMKETSRKFQAVMKGFRNLSTKIDDREANVSDREPDKM